MTEHVVANSGISSYSTATALPLALQCVPVDRRVFYAFDNLFGEVIRDHDAYK